MVSWSGFYGDAQGSTGSYELLSGRSPNRFHLMRLLRKTGMRAVGEVISTLLTDSTPATNASVITSQVDAVATPVSGQNSQGGVRGVTAQETIDLVLDSDKDDLLANITRAVSAGDVTTLQQELIPSGDQNIRAPTDGSGTILYPDDASGNGGGGKLS